LFCGSGVNRGAKVIVLKEARSNADRELIANRFGSS
jgi:hypothetical protein